MTGIEKAVKPFKTQTAVDAVMRGRALVHFSFFPFLLLARHFGALFFNLFPSYNATQSL